MNKKKLRQKKKKDRSRNDKGILLEQIVAMLHASEGVKVESNVKLFPKSGDKTRKCEIDVLLTSEVAGYPVRIPIQCKNHKERVERKVIGEFKDSLEDVGIPVEHGIIVSVNGYQSGAIKRAKELGIKTFVLEGLTKERLKKEIRDTFQYFVHLLLVVEEMHITTGIPDLSAWTFFDEDKQLCGFLTDLIVSCWRNGEIPSKLGEYELDLKIPTGWHQLRDDKFVFPDSMSAKVRVVAYLAEMKGKFEEIKLKEADTNKIEKLHIKADFDVLNNLIQASNEEPIFTEAELNKLKKNSNVSVEHRIKLPKIFVTNHLEPFSQKAFNFFLQGTKNLSLEEIEILPTPTFEEVEGDAFGAMLEDAAMGEPVIIEANNGELIDIRLLAKQGKDDEIIEFAPLLNKYQRKDFAEYLSVAYFLQGKSLLDKASEEKSAIRKNLENQAFNYFDNSIKLATNLADLYFSIGFLFRKHKFYAKSIEFFEASISLDPKNLINQGNLAETHYLNGQSKKALNIVNEIIENNSTFPLTIPLLRAEILYTLKKYKESTSDLVNIWKDDYKVITEKHFSRKLVSDLYRDFQVMGVAAILVDVYNYYINKFAKENSFDESKKYLDATITMLENLFKATLKDNLKDYWSESYKPVLLRTKDTIKNISSFYPVNSWENRIDLIDKDLD